LGSEINLPQISHANRNIDTMIPQMSTLDAPPSSLLAKNIISYMQYNIYNIIYTI